MSRLLEVDRAGDLCWSRMVVIRRRVTSTNDGAHSMSCTRVSSYANFFSLFGHKIEFCRYRTGCNGISRRESCVAVNDWTGWSLKRNRPVGGFAGWRFVGVAALASGW